MSTGLLLLGYAVAAGAVGQRILSGLTDRTSYPLLGVVSWLAACGSVLTAGLLAGLLVAGWHVPDVAAPLVNACLTLTGQSGDHDHVSLPLLAVPAIAAVGARGLWSAARGYAAEVRLRRRHLHDVRLVGRADEGLGAIVVDTDESAIYCVAGPAPTIVLTSGALRSLSGPQLAAALDHERCHLTERHHLIVRACRMLARAFPFVALFRHACTRIGALLEMRADDFAARRHGSRVVATALAAVIESPSPGVSLAAGGPSAAARAGRLLTGRRRRVRDRWRLVAATVALAGIPVAGLLVPLCGA